jgi:hypothetical protein
METLAHRLRLKRQGPFMEEIFRERERGERGSRGKRLRREITLESNLRVNLIWVGWVNFNLGGFFFFIWIGLIFFGLGYF